MSPERTEPAIPGSEWPQTNFLDRAATGIVIIIIIIIIMRRRRRIRRRRNTKNWRMKYVLCGSKRQHK